MLKKKQLLLVFDERLTVGRERPKYKCLKIKFWTTTVEISNA